MSDKQSEPNRRITETLNHPIFLGLAIMGNFLSIILYISTAHDGFLIASGVLLIFTAVFVVVRVSERIRYEKENPLAPIPAVISIAEKTESRIELVAPSSIKANALPKPQISFAKISESRLENVDHRFYRQTFTAAEGTYQTYGAFTVGFRNTGSDEILPATNVSARVIYRHEDTNRPLLEIDRGIWIDTEEREVTLSGLDPQYLILLLYNQRDYFGMVPEWKLSGGMSGSPFPNFERAVAYVCLTFGESRTQTNVFKFRLTQGEVRVKRPTCIYIGEGEMPSLL